MSTPLVSTREFLRTFGRIALLSFGGPAGQIAVMHRILIEEKHWISEARFLHALNYCMLLPGPEAHQLAVYVGWLLRKTWGGLIAGTLFILPGLLSLGMLSLLYAAFGHVGIVQGLFFGLKAAVLAVVLEAVIRIGKRALKSTALVAIAVLAFIGMFFFALPFPLLIMAAALTGFAANQFGFSGFAGSPHGIATKPDSVPALIDGAFAKGIPDHVRPAPGRFIRIAVTGLLLWLLPLMLCFLLLGPDNVFTAIAAFNSKMAVLTYGGAYAVLAYMAQQAVEHYQWLKPDEMLVGLGFAETTPGPLISVVQFVGFMAAFRAPGVLDPFLAGTLGGLMAMWATFVPSFLWIFLGGPYVEALIGNRALHAALSAITGAVVGVILNLAVWLALHTLFAEVANFVSGPFNIPAPVWRAVNWPAAILAAFSLIAVFRLRLGILPVLAMACLAGVGFYFSGFIKP